MQKIEHATLNTCPSDQTLTNIGCVPKTLFTPSVCPLSQISSTVMKIDSTNDQTSYPICVDPPTIGKILPSDIQNGSSCTGATTKTTVGCLPNYLFHPKDICVYNGWSYATVTRSDTGEGDNICIPHIESGLNK